MSPTILISNPTPDLYGSSRMAVESAAAMREAGWRVVVTMTASGPLVDALEAVGAEVRLCETPVLRKGLLNPRGLARLAWQVVRSVPAGLRLLRDVRPDVLYANTVLQPLWIMLAWVRRVPVVGHVHEGEASATKLMRKVLAAPLLCASAIIVNSRFSTGVLVGAIARLGSRAVVVYNGVAGPPVVVAPRESLDPPIRLLYVGRLSERKGVRDAVDAVGILEQRGFSAVLDVVGDIFPGYEWVEDDLRARIGWAGTTQRVRLLGFQPDVWPHLADGRHLAGAFEARRALRQHRGGGRARGAPGHRHAHQRAPRGHRRMAAAITVEPADPMPRCAVSKPP